MENENLQFQNLKDVSEAKWNKLSQKKVCFGHQSVGFNILEGVKDIMQGNQHVRLNIVDITNGGDNDAPILGHFWVGKNCVPRSKTEAFKKFIEDSDHSEFDVAFFKFCFVDITDSTDIHAVFNDYKKKMAQLMERYPGTTFVHVTVPLTCVPEGVQGMIRRTKNIIKRMMGKSVFNLDDNTQRVQFNELMVREYKGKFSLFDLAKIESIYPDGRRAFSEEKGERLYSLVPEYTYDGGHLNEEGRKIVAGQLLIFLANLCK